jgi:hypothetical protein
MNLFIKYLAPLIREFPQVTLSRRLELDIQNHCMRVLGVKDMGELRDRFEGQKYLDNALYKASSYFACANFIGQADISLEKALDSNDLTFQIDGCSYGMLVFNFGELPLISITESPLILVLKKDVKTFSICGIATKEVLDDEKNYTIEKGKKYFIGFQNLSEIKKISL